MRGVGGADHCPGIDYSKTSERKKDNLSVDLFDAIKLISSIMVAL